MGEQTVARREVLTGAAALAAFTILPGRARGANERLNIAGIGVGGMGGGNLARVAGSENIVALCDVDPNHAGGAIKRWPQARFWVDYRQMLAEQKDIDAVVIATPDHTHAVISMAAIKAGKHVYCQKPLTHTVWEARMLAEAARQSKVATQMGIQGHSGGGGRSICEWIWDGAIGEVREVDAWCSLSYYPWGHAGWSSRWGSRPKETPPLPDKLNWDLWLGPAPERPYHPAYHPGVWRCWWDFGCGMMGDRGAHTLDCVFWALKLGQPTSVEATSCGLNPDTHPLSAIVTFRFAAREGFPPLKLTWYEGTRPPRPEDLIKDLDLPKEGGVIFKGTKGKIVAGVYGNGPYLLPETLHREYKRPAASLPRVPGENHEMEWVNAAKAGTQPGAHFGYSGPLTEMCLLGNVTKRLDARIEWDPVNVKVTNRDDAGPWVRMPYRQGWSL
jgi:predicted dehydrogenase